MLANLIRELTYQILVEIGRRAAGAITSSSPAPAWLQNLIEAYWDLAYWYKHGFPLIPVPDPEEPLPTPSPMSGSFIRDTLLLDVFELAMGDPHPQPSSLSKLIGNNEIRITAVKNLLEQINRAVPQLEAEIRDLQRPQ
jgi:hypothetical protein